MFNSRIWAAIGLAAAMLTLVVIAVTPAKAGSWSGCYGGVHGGYTAALNDMSLNATGFGEILGFNALGGSDFSYGGMAGCDMQVQKFVVGVWGDYTWDNAAFDVTVFGGAGLPPLATMALENRWGVGGRVGYLFVPGALGYVLAGYTQADLSPLASPLFGAALPTPTLDGYVVGGGGEFDLGNHLYLQAQYTFSQYEDASIALGGPLSVGIDTDVHTARVGLLYRLNWVPVDAPPFKDYVAPSNKPLK